MEESSGKSLLKNIVPGRTGHMPHAGTQTAARRIIALYDIQFMLMNENRC